jgi:hypothetical protein
MDVLNSLFTNSFVGFQDYEETIDEIVRASSLPLSIVIVGVGLDDFSDIRKLISAKKLLYSKSLGKSPEREIIHFVQFNQFKNNLKEFIKQTLAQIPNQVMNFMGINKIKLFKPCQKRSQEENLFFEKKKNDFFHQAVKMGFNPQKVF